MTDDTRPSIRPSPQEQVMGAAIGVIQGRCLAAAELGLADALAKGPLSVDAIATQTKADVDNVFRLMRALETIGVFKQVSPRVFENTPMSDCLRKDVPGSQWAFLQVFAPGWGIWDGLGEMLQTLRTGKRPWLKPEDMTFGNTIEDILSSGRCSTRPCVQ
jgi:Dimerisation domain